MENYLYVILDSSFFRSLFSQETRSFLKRNRLVLAADFFAVYNSYMPLLSDKQKRYQKSNYLFVESLFRSNPSRVQFLKDDADCKDTLRTVIDYRSRGMSPLCVATCDITLIERLILTAPNGVDLFDLNRGIIIPSSDFRKLKNQLEVVHPNNTESERVPFSVQSGTTVYGLDNTAYVLGENQGMSGKEGLIYSIKDNERLVAKVFRKYAVGSQEKHLKELCRIARQTPVPWCSFPTDILRFDNHTIGILMPRIKATVLKSISVYRGNGDINLQSAPDIDPMKYSELLRYITGVIAQSNFLRAYCGLTVFDYNHGNLSAWRGDQATVFYDTDSFMCRNYFSCTVNDTIFSRDYLLDHKEELYAMADESLCKLVFTLLSLGYEPYTGNRRFVFCSDIDNQTRAYVKNYFPPKVYAYLERVFTGKEVPSPQYLLTLLRDVQKHLRSDPAIKQLRRRARPDFIK